MIGLNDKTDPSGMLRNLRDMGANDNVLTAFGTMNAECASEIMLFIADFGQRLVAEDREKAATCACVHSCDFQGRSPCSGCRARP